MLSFKYIIIDLDGTLVDSFDSVCDSLALTMNQLSLANPERTFYESFRDRDLSTLFKGVYSSCSHDVPWKTFKTLFDDIYTHHCTENVHVTPMGEKIVEYCKKQDIKIVVLTNKLQLAADIICTSLFPIGVFTDIIGRNGVRPIKPYKYAIARLSRHQLSPTLCQAYFGDSTADERMARLMNVPYYDIQQLDDHLLQTIMQSINV